MSKTRRRAYPIDKLEREERKHYKDVKYGNRGNARGKRTERATGGGRQFKGER